MEKKNSQGVKGEAAEQQFNKLAKNNLKIAVDEAREQEHMIGEVFIAIGGALPSMVNKEEGAVKTTPGNERRIVQASRRTAGVCNLLWALRSMVTALWSVVRSCHKGRHGGRHAHTWWHVTQTWSRRLAVKAVGTTKSTGLSRVRGQETKRNDKVESVETEGKRMKLGRKVAMSWRDKCWTSMKWSKFDKSAFVFPSSFFRRKMCVQQCEMEDVRFSKESHGKAGLTPLSNGG